MPVILLTDKVLATRMEVIHKPDLSQWCELWERRTAAGGDGDYKRYALTEDAVSPMGIPGKEGGQYVATGIEHDEIGHPPTTPKTHVAMTDKRFRKLEPLQGRAARHESATSGPSIAVIGFGSTTGRCARRSSRARRGPVGRRVLPRVLGPFPAGPVNAFVGGGEPRHRARGQLHRPARAPGARRVRPPVESHAKSDGLPVHGRGCLGHHHEGATS